MKKVLKFIVVFAALAAFAFATVAVASGSKDTKKAPAEKSAVKKAEPAKKAAPAKAKSSKKKPAKLPDEGC